MNSKAVDNFLDFLLNCYACLYEKYTIVSLLVLSFILSPVLVNAQTQSESNSCLQNCRRQMEENCATYPDSPVCPKDISRRCELNCKVAEFIYLNEEFSLDIGEKTTVKNYDNMAITLLRIKKTGTRKGDLTASFTADLEIKKGDETKFVSLKGKEKKEVFGRRLDFVTIIFSYPPGFNSNSKAESLNAAIPSVGVFGLYEKGVGGFWARISNWLKRLF